MKKALCLLFASVMVLSLAACGGNNGSKGISSAPKQSESESVTSEEATSISTEPTDTVADTEMLEQELRGVKFQVPQEWAKQDDDSQIFYYPDSSAVEVNEMVMMMYTDLDEITSDNLNEVLDAYVDGMATSDEVNDLTKEPYTELGVDALKTTHTQTVDGAEYKFTSYVLPVNTDGIFFISFASNGKTKENYQPYYDQLMDSIEFPDPSKDTTTSNSDGNSSQSSEKTDSESTTETASTDEFVSDVKTAIDGDVGKDERITDVRFENGDLCVYVDLSSKADSSPLPLEYLADSRTSSITESILELTEYDDLWDTITVDFGSVGKITNDKSDIRDDGYGRYFDFNLDDLTLE